MLFIKDYYKRLFIKLNNISNILNKKNIELYIYIYYIHISFN